MTTNMPSVLHLCTDFWPNTGGIENFVRDLSTHSQTSGIATAVMCYNRLKHIQEPLPKTDTIDGIPIFRIPFVDLKFYKPTALPLEILKRYDILHVHGIGAILDYVALSFRFHKRPIVLSTHGGIFHTATLLPVKQIYFRKVIPVTLRKVKIVAACSKSDLSLFSTVSDRVELLENAVDVKRFLEIPLENKIPNRFLYVGRLSDNKGIPELVAAFSAAKRLGADYTLHLIGPDPDRRWPGLLAKIRELGIEQKVTYLGEVDSETLHEQYKAAAFFVSASRYEGFGLSAIEGQAAGCRLLVNRNEAFESLFHKHPAVTLLDFTDSETAGSIITQSLIGRPTTTELLECRSAAGKYAWEQKIYEWHELYRRAITRSN